MTGDAIDATREDEQRAAFFRAITLPGAADRVLMHAIIHLADNDPEPWVVLTLTAQTVEGYSAQEVRDLGNQLHALAAKMDRVRDAANQRRGF